MNSLVLNHFIKTKYIYNAHCFNSDSLKVLVLFFVQIPFMPSYLDRMMPLTTLLSSTATKIFFYESNLTPSETRWLKKLLVQKNLGALFVVFYST